MLVCNWLQGIYVSLFKPFNFRVINILFLFTVLMHHQVDSWWTKDLIKILNLNLSINPIIGSFILSFPFPFILSFHWKKLHVNHIFVSSLQAKFMEDMPSETISKIHLVDLAGRFVIHWFTFLLAVFVTFWVLSKFLYCKYCETRWIFTLKGHKFFFQNGIFWGPI